MRHLVEASDAARVAFDFFGLGAVGRVERENRQAARRDRAGKFAFVVAAAAVLIHFDRSAPAIAVNGEPHHHDHVADVVFHSQGRQLRIVGRRLGEDDRSQPEAPEAVNELEEMAAQQIQRRPRREERGRGIEHDRLGARLRDQMFQDLSIAKSRLQKAARQAAIGVQPRSSPNEDATRWN